MSKIWFYIADKIIEQVNMKDLYIKPEINDIEKIKILRNKKLTSTNIINNNIYINEKYIEKDLKNIKKLSFNSFYPNLLIKLIDYKIIKIDNINYYIIFKYFFKNIMQMKNTDLYFIIKIFINYFYGILVSNKINKINSENFEEFDRYKYFIYNDLKNKLQDDLIYIDTDTIYYIDNNYDISYNIPHEIENISAFKILRAKKYIEVKDNIIKYKGLK